MSFRLVFWEDDKRVWVARNIVVVVDSMRVVVEDNMAGGRAVETSNIHPQYH